jgi:MFS family permease
MPTSPSAETAAETAVEPGAPSPAGLPGRYRQLAVLAGAGFLPIGFLARMPVAMMTVGALTLATSATGSYALGGMAAGAAGLGAAAGAPAQGYLADRTGQRSVLLAAAAAHTLAIAGLLAAAAFIPQAAPVLLAAAALTGLTCPQVGPLARVRWMGLARRRPGVLDAALSYESTADELTFVLGPALVGLLASLAAPWLPFVLAAILTATMVCAFAVHPTHRAARPVPAVPAPKVRTPLRRAWLLRAAVPVLGMTAMGTFFGAVQNALNAFGGSFGAAESAGLLYALVGLSSAATALSVAVWPAGFTHAWRWVLCAAGLLAGSLLLLLPQSPAPMAAALLAAGLPVGPVLVTVFSIGGQVAPQERLGTVMTMLASGLVLGSALGAALAGTVAQAHGHGGAFLVAAGAAAAMLLLSLLGILAVRRAR